MAGFTKLINLKLSKSLFVILTSIFLILFLTIKYSPPFSVQEINALVASKSVLAGELSNNNFIDFARSNGFFISPLSVFASLLFEFLLPHSFILAKIPNILLLLGVFVLYNKILIKQVSAGSSKSANLILLVLLVTSPWLIQTALYNPSNLISLTFFVLSAVYLKKAFFDNTSQEKDKRFFFVFLILLSLSSIQGLLTSSVMFLASATLFFKTKKIKTKKIAEKTLRIFSAKKIRDL